MAAALLDMLVEARHIVLVKVMTPGRFLSAGTFPRPDRLHLQPSTGRSATTSPKTVGTETVGAGPHRELPPRPGPVLDRHHHRRAPGTATP
ncbi:hypothetical protein, partial [Pseudonocardia sp. Ae331_Ps2]